MEHNASSAQDQPGAPGRQAAGRTVYTGVTRQRQTRRGVKIADTAARGLITAGGIGTIIAVLLVCFFLVWVAVPLFLPARIDADPPTAHPDWSSRPPLQMATDEYRTMALVIRGGGDLEVYRTSDGALISTRQLFGGEVPTAAATSTNQTLAAFGFADGRVLMGEIGFGTPVYLDEDAVPPELTHLQPGESTGYRDGVVTCTNQRQYRLLEPSHQFEQVVPPRAGSSVALLDLTVVPAGPVLSVLTADRRLSLMTFKERQNMLTGEVVRRVTDFPIPYPENREILPCALRLSGVANMLHLVWADGTLLRYDLRDRRKPRLAETRMVLDGDRLEVTAVEYMIGKETLVIGDSSGGVSCWFPSRPTDATSSDGVELTRGHAYPPSGSAVTALAPSSRSRMIAAGHQDGTIDLYYVTNDNHLATLAADAPLPIQALAIAPKDDGLIAATSQDLLSWSLDLRHPDATLSSLFRPVWYEGRDKPVHVWQSSSGTDDFEAKLSLWPLVFGTIKATLYCLLFGVPLALLAALYTSEFLHPKARARIKPVIELMASLPSVVLGFLAALVVAPFVESAVTATLMAFLSIPVSLLAGGHLWQMLPGHITRRFDRWRLLIILPTIPAAIGAAILASPFVERLLFAGDIKAWADGQIGSGVGAWVLILAPVFGLLVALGISRWAGPRSRRHSPSASLFAFLAGAGLSLVAAVVIGFLLDLIGLDPRGHLIDTYVQRNAMIVGFMMGFAIIPIIYTIAEDALSTVPDHLRSASLAAGATRWQTARRVVVPTAMSGLFSAVMIGVGRAVGETMIVLMAAGNTPIMDWNIFNGFRTLSANIATELPEAVPGSSHYRTLFLAALLLFAMTFVLNTLAEVVRQRFRRRAYEL